MNARARLISVSIAVVISLALGVLAAWPTYQSWWLIVAATTAIVLGVGIAVLGSKRLSPLLTIGALAGAFILTVVPAAMPQSFERMPMGLLRGLLDGVAAIVLGWKQLLTLTLPVGTYQSVMVPAYLVFLLTAFIATTVALRTGRFAPLAAFALAAPVAFGTIFGASAVSASIVLGPITIHAPREIALWLGAAVLGAAWVWLTAGAERRAALRRGRLPGERQTTGGSLVRLAIGAATVVVALAAGLMLAPVLDAGAREVPRDRIDPEIVLRERTSPLAAYRASKRDAALDAPLFEVATQGALPARLRLAVLDEYDGVDFHVGAAEAGRFTRFPSGDRVSDPSNIVLRISEGYSDIWVPTAGLGSVPSFSGPRASELADAFYVNRATGAAIAVPGGENTQGLTAGDGFEAVMQTTPDEALTGGPASDGPALDLDTMPELATWLKAQDQPATAEGLIELLDRLRTRGYLSHSLSDAEGERLWLERLSREFGTQFEPSAGGHSSARIEQLFTQLNTQARLAGDDAPAEMMVAGIGDDEQFATAAALIARALGFDSRVVLGVRLADGDASPDGVPSCEQQCTGENLAAWVEVRGDQQIWVPLDATPQVQMRPTALEEGEQLPEFATTPEERDAREVDPPLGLGERSDNASDAEELPTESWVLPLLRLAGLALAALVLLALPFLFLPLAKRLRSSRRRAETEPEIKALGAWQEMVDGAVDHGVEVPARASREEAAQVLDTAPARWAAATATRAVFSAQGISPQEAEWMWDAVSADRVAREENLTRMQKIRARYSLRSYGVKIVKWPTRAAESAAVPQNEAE